MGKLQTESANRPQVEPAVHIEVWGGVQSWWVTLPGEPSRCCGQIANTTRDQAIDCARRQAHHEHLTQDAEARLRSRHPQGGFIRGMLPSSYSDAPIWDGLTGEYIYILSARRKRVNGTLKAVVTDYELIA